jgi:hypothetical protein
LFTNKRRIAMKSEGEDGSFEDVEEEVIAPCQFEGTDACEYCDIVPCLNDEGKDDDEEHF